jgi:parallel beta-helix repeat protein
MSKPSKSPSPAKQTGRYLRLKFERKPPSLKYIGFRYSSDPAWSLRFYERGNKQNLLNWPDVERAISLCFVGYVKWAVTKSSGPYLFGSEPSAAKFAKQLSGAISQTAHDIHQLFLGFNPKKNDDPDVTHLVFPAIPGINKSGRVKGKPVWLAIDRTFLPPDCIELFWDELGKEQLVGLRDIKKLANSLREAFTESTPSSAQLATRNRTGEKNTIAGARNDDGNLNLEQALEIVEPGGTVELLPGVFNLSAPLKIEKSVNLVGQDPGRTIVRCRAEGGVALFLGKHQWSVYGISFERFGTVQSNVVEVLGGEIDITNCSFSGARIQSGKVVVAGLAIRDAFGSISRCNFHENLMGISLLEQANLSITNNRCWQNKWAGIFYSKDATGTCISNECWRNRTGIAANGNSNPTVEGNICHDNMTGIWLAESSKGTIIENWCHSNINGIGCTDRVTARIQRNECENNREYGIAVGGHTAFQLDHNTCIGNHKAGIALFGKTKAIVLSNTVKSSPGGIWVAQRATPRLKENDCESNADGIRYSGESAGTSTGNRTICNEIGIKIMGRAHPVLGDNVCSKNSKIGIAVCEEASPELRANSCSLNEIGLAIGKDTAPSLIGNTIIDNSKADLLDTRGINSRLPSSKM